MLRRDNIKMKTRYIFGGKKPVCVYNEVHERLYYFFSDDYCCHENIYL